ncbi:ribonuclease domain-containing protein [Nocardia sp. BMG51109]|uniref:WXG100-like domain-containing protein n=1 Tax=Nocardia sp. BMG51109 TaxID=1056816 RepID=UPI000464A6D2|nr:ribonuclease domain-containing protein [Nocardia sp. BMG51109]
MGDESDGSSGEIPPDVPGWARWVAGLTWVIGGDWPFGDADMMQQMADELSDVQRLVNDIVRDIEDAKAAALDAYISGEAHDKMEEAFDALLSGDQSVAAIADHYGNLAGAAEEFAGQIYAAKVDLVISLAWMVGEIIYAMSAGPEVGAPVAAQAMTVTRFSFKTIGELLLNKLGMMIARRFGKQMSEIAIKKFARAFTHYGWEAVQESFEEIGQTVFQDVAGHLITNVAGYRHDWRWDQFGADIGLSALGGAAGGLAGVRLHNSGLAEMNVPFASGRFEQAVRNQAIGGLSGLAGNAATMPWTGFDMKGFVSSGISSGLPSAAGAFNRNVPNDGFGGPGHTFDAPGADVRAVADGTAAHPGPSTGSSAPSAASAGSTGGGAGARQHATASGGSGVSGPATTGTADPARHDAAAAPIEARAAGASPVSEGAHGSPVPSGVSGAAPAGASPTPSGVSGAAPASAAMASSGVAGSSAVPAAPVPAQSAAPSASNDLGTQQDSISERSGARPAAAPAEASPGRNPSFVGQAGRAGSAAPNRAGGIEATGADSRSIGAENASLETAAEDVGTHDVPGSGAAADEAVVGPAYISAAAASGRSAPSGPDDRHRSGPDADTALEDRADAPDSARADLDAELRQLLAVEERVFPGGRGAAAPTVSGQGRSAAERAARTERAVHLLAGPDRRFAERAFVLGQSDATIAAETGSSVERVARRRELIGAVLRSTVEHRIAPNSDVLQGNRAWPVLASEYLDAPERVREDMSRLESLPRRLLTDLLEGSWDIGTLSGETGLSVGRIAQELNEAVDRVVGIRFANCGPETLERLHRRHGIVGTLPHGIGGLAGTSFELIASELPGRVEAFRGAGGLTGHGQLVDALRRSGRDRPEVPSSAAVFDIRHDPQPDGDSVPGDAGAASPGHVYAVCYLGEFDGVEYFEVDGQLVEFGGFDAEGRELFRRVEDAGRDAGGRSAYRYTGDGGTLHLADLTGATVAEVRDVWGVIYQGESEAARAVSGVGEPSAPDPGTLFRGAGDIGRNGENNPAAGDSVPESRPERLVREWRQELSWSRWRDRWRGLRDGRAEQFYFPGSKYSGEVISTILHDVVGLLPDGRPNDSPILQGHGGYLPDGMPNFDPTDYVKLVALFVRKFRDEGGPLFIRRVSESARRVAPGTVPTVVLRDGSVYETWNGHVGPADARVDRSVRIDRLSEEFLSRALHAAVLRDPGAATGHAAIAHADRAAAWDRFAELAAALGIPLSAGLPADPAAALDRVLRQAEYHLIRRAGAIQGLEFARRRYNAEQAEVPYSHTRSSHDRNPVDRFRREQHRHETGTPTEPVVPGISGRVEELLPSVYEILNRDRDGDRDRLPFRLGNSSGRADFQIALRREQLLMELEDWEWLGRGQITGLPPHEQESVMGELWAGLEAQARRVEALRGFAAEFLAADHAAELHGAESVLPKPPAGPAESEPAPVQPLTEQDQQRMWQLAKEFGIALDHSAPQQVQQLVTERRRATAVQAAMMCALVDGSAAAATFDRFEGLTGPWSKLARLVGASPAEATPQGVAEFLTDPGNGRWERRRVVVQLAGYIDELRRLNPDAVDAARDGLAIGLGHDPGYLSGAAGKVDLQQLYSAVLDAADYESPGPQHSRETIAIAECLGTLRALDPTMTVWLGDYGADPRPLDKELGIAVAGGPQLLSEIVGDTGDFVDFLAETPLSGPDASAAEPLWAQVRGVDIAPLFASESVDSGSVYPTAEQRSRLTLENAYEIVRVYAAVRDGKFDEYERRSGEDLAEFRRGLVEELRGRVEHLNELADLLDRHVDSPAQTKPPPRRLPPEQQARARARLDTLIVHRDRFAHAALEVATQLAELDIDAESGSMRELMSTLRDEYEAEPEPVRREKLGAAIHAVLELDRAAADLQQSMNELAAADTAGTDSPATPETDDSVTLARAALQRRADMVRAETGAEVPAWPRALLSGRRRSGDAVWAAGELAALNARWWDATDGAARDALLQRYPEWIGNADGIPARVRHRANVTVMRSDLVRLRDRFLSHPAGDKRPTDAERLLQVQLDQVLAAVDAEAARKLGALGEIGEPGPDRSVTGESPLLVMRYHGMTFGAAGNFVVCLGDPDVAKAVDYVVPHQDTAVAGLRRELPKAVERERKYTGPGAPLEVGEYATVIWLGDRMPELNDASGDTRVRPRKGELLACDIAAARAAHRARGGPGAQLPAVYLQGWGTGWRAVALAEDLLRTELPRTEMPTVMAGRMEVGLPGETPRRPSGYVGAHRSSGGLFFRGNHRGSYPPLRDTLRPSAVEPATGDDTEGAVDPRTCAIVAFRAAGEGPGRPRVAVPSALRGRIALRGLDPDLAARLAGCEWRRFESMDAMRERADLGGTIIGAVDSPNGVVAHAFTIVRIDDEMAGRRAELWPGQLMMTEQVRATDDSGGFLLDGDGRAVMTTVEWIGDGKVAERAAELMAEAGPAATVHGLVFGVDGKPDVRTSGEEHGGQQYSSRERRPANALGLRNVDEDGEKGDAPGQSAVAASGVGKGDASGSSAVAASGVGKGDASGPPAAAASGSGSAPAVPDRAHRTLAEIDAGRWPGSAGAPGTKGGGRYKNQDEKLSRTDPSGKAITYKEWDVNPKKRDRARDRERIVTGSDGSVHYTDDHYENFTRMR